MAREEGELEDRIPCPDEMCVGIIGPSGRCGVCSQAGEPGAAPAVHGADEEEEEEEEEAEEGATGHDEVSAFDPDERVLCPDEMCTGIVGPDRRCGTCGRSA